MVKKLCFVIMPFSSTNRCSTEDWTEIFENVHKPAITGSRFGYKCERSKIRTGAFIEDIILQLNQADVVLADLTDMNANVFYELGVRHTLRNRTILVSQTMDDIPSDLKQYGVILYNTTTKSVDEYKKQMRIILKDIQNNPDRGDNPVSDYLHMKNRIIEQFEAKTIEKKLIALVSECSFNLSVVEASLKNADKEKTSINSARFAMGALELLTSTYYIYPDDNYIKTAILLLRAFTTQNGQLELLQNSDFRNPVKENIRKLFPMLDGVLKDFMQQTHKILKDFRNQNFIEPTELEICVGNDTHKEILDV